MRALLFATCLTAAAATYPAQAADLKLPNKPDSVKFLVLGDTGTGDREQYEVAKVVEEYRRAFPFTFSILLGDNLYGGERASDFEKKFERPYKALLDGGVKFYAALGNHDNPNQKNYKLFNMNGERFYSFKPKDGVRFFALDSNYMDRTQMEWLEKELGNSGSEWKIVFCHHPLYSSGRRHGPDDDLRQAIEPILLKHGVSVVFAGHEHFYERLKPQKGIYHFTSGAAAKLRRGNIARGENTAAGFDQDQSFMIVEIDGDKMHFQTISRAGKTVDAGVIERAKPVSRSGDVRTQAAGR